MARVVVAKRRNTLAFCLLVLGWLATGTPFSAPAVHAQQQHPQQVVLDLNRQAMEAYNALDVNKAGSMLEEALRVGYEGRVPPQMMSRTSMNLGIVYVGGLDDQDHGLNYFVQALCGDPSTQLDPLMSSPDVQNVWSVAMQRAQAGACTGGCPATAASRAGCPCRVRHRRRRRRRRNRRSSISAGRATRADAAAAVRGDQPSGARQEHPGLLQGPRHEGVQGGPMQLPGRLCVPD